jgi:hypothetical protein
MFHEKVYLNWKALGESNLIEFILKFSELRCGRYLIFEWILLLEIETNSKKLGLEGKISWAPQCVHIENFHSENVKNKECVHTWANRAQATLVRIGS